MNSGSEVRVALVTGASKWIGRAAALALAEAGLDVVVTARSVEGALERTAHAVSAHGRRALALPFDLANVESVDTTVDSALAEFGHIDVLMNNAFLVGAAGNAMFRSRYAKFLSSARHDFEPRRDRQHLTSRWIAVDICVSRTERY